MQRWGQDSGQPGTQSLALIVDGPDAPGGVFVHWVLFNVAQNIQQLGEGVERIQDGALQGRNDFGRIGYGGPCPPCGPAHGYRFTLYALEKPLDLKPGAMKGHIIVRGQLQNNMLIV